jgi:predicted lipoprotein with Yx(FWY)xxD motif
MDQGAPRCRVTGRRRRRVRLPLRPLLRRRTLQRRAGASHRRTSRAGPARNGAGHEQRVALYIFLPDAARHVTCTGDCASAWPALTLHAGETVAAGAGVRADLLGTVPDPGGGRVVTYHGWPLYTYLGDASPGHAAGQGKDDDGGYWYVMRPSGQILSP